MKKGCFFREVERPSREGLLTWKRRSGLRLAVATKYALHHLTAMGQRGSSRDSHPVSCASYPTYFIFYIDKAK